MENKPATTILFRKGISLLGPLGIFSDKLQFIPAIIHNSLDYRARDLKTEVFPSIVKKIKCY